MPQLLAMLIRFFRSRRDLLLEVAVLRHQLDVYQRQRPQPRLPTDGSDVLDLAESDMAEMEVCSCHRSARHGASLAPRRLPASLAPHLSK